MHLKVPSLCPAIPTCGALSPLRLVLFTFPTRYPVPPPGAAALTLAFPPTALLPSSCGGVLLLRCLPRCSGRPLAQHTMTSRLPCTSHSLPPSHTCTPCHIL